MRRDVSEGRRTLVKPLQFLKHDKNATLVVHIKNNTKLKVLESVKFTLAMFLTTLFVSKMCT